MVLEHEFLYILAVFCVILVGSIYAYLQYKHHQIDWIMVQSFRKLLNHEFYEKFQNQQSVAGKIHILNQLKDHADTSEYDEEFKIASREILVKMRYDLKLIKCEAKAQAIIERMNR